MSLALFSHAGFLFCLRWLHIFFGIIWIGHLYYFNFVQGAFFAEVDAGTKSTAIQKLVPRALWWFRWGAMYTLITGLLILMIYGHDYGSAFFSSSLGILITAGAGLGVLMWFNVWFVIWPSQKVVIQSATQAASGGQAIPEAAARAARAGVASRHNVLFSIPMLFFMASASHLPITVNSNANLTLLAVVLTVVYLGLELNALKGKTGVITTVKGVLTWGFVLTAFLYGLIEFMVR